MQPKYTIDIAYYTLQGVYTLNSPSSIYYSHILQCMEGLTGTSYMAAYFSSSTVLLSVESAATRTSSGTEAKFSFRNWCFPLKN